MHLSILISAVAPYLLSVCTAAPMPRASSDESHLETRDIHFLPRGLHNRLHSLNPLGGPKMYDGNGYIVTSESDAETYADPTHDNDSQETRSKSPNQLSTVEEVEKGTVSSSEIIKRALMEDDELADDESSPRRRPNRRTKSRNYSNY